MMAMRSIWAVAKNTIAQAMRMKIAVVIFLLLLVLLPLMVMITEGDGSLKGKLQTFMSYGLSLMSIMLCMLTIAISCFTLSNDIKFKHIFLVVTKPVMRFQILVGKFIGLVIIEVFLITIFAVIIYAGTMFIPRLSKASDAEIAMVIVSFLQHVGSCRFILIRSFCRSERRRCMRSLRM
jgi:ABC-type transport system involved in multi-copper enzyme maturation permease subunit